MSEAFSDNKSRSIETNKLKEVMLDCMFWQTKQLIVIVSSEARLLALNPAAEVFFGYTTKQIQNKHALGVLVPHRNRYGGETARYLDLLKTSEEPFNFENENLDVEGNMHWVQWEIIPQKNAYGLKTWICMGRNTSLEQEVHNSTSWDYRTFANMLPEIVFELDEDLNLTFLNDYSFYALGYNRQEVAGTEAFLKKITHPREYVRLVSYVQTIFMGELHSTKKFTLHSKSGNELIVELQYTPVLNDGVVERIRGIAFDITQKEKDFFDLAAKEERFRLIYENSPINYLSINEQGIIVDANPATIGMLKEQKEQVIGQLFSQYICKQGRSGYNYLFQKFKSLGEVRNAELQLCRKDGSQIFVQLSGRAIYHPNGELKQTYCVLKNITDLKLAEISLKRSEHVLRELNATKDKFFSIIAHDLKNPFNDLIGFTQLLSRNVRKYNEYKIEQFTQIIQESAKLAYNLLENLLDWSRAQTGTLRFQPERLEMVRLIENCIKLYESKALAKKVRLFFNPDFESLFVKADKNMLMTVIRNLISNAIKYTFPDDEIAIELALKHPDVWVSVKDTGIGMDREKVKSLFRIDANASTPGTSQETGTGLGLILCKEFVEKNGGKILAVSTPGEGSVFSFSLPYSPIKKQS